MRRNGGVKCDTEIDEREYFYSNIFIFYINISRWGDGEDFKNAKKIRKKNATVAHETRVLT